MPIKFEYTWFFFDIALSFLKASYSELGSPILSKSFDKIFSEVEFPKNINLNFELPLRYEKYFKENIEKAREILHKL